MFTCISGSFYNYNDYEGSFAYSEEDDVYFGKILDIDDFVNYEGRDLSELYQSFKNAVDGYIEFKKEIGKD